MQTCTCTAASVPSCCVRSNFHALGTPKCVIRGVSYQVSVPTQLAFARSDECMSGPARTCSRVRCHRVIFAWPLATGILGNWSCAVSFPGGLPPHHPTPHGPRAPKVLGSNSVIGPQKLAKCSDHSEKLGWQTLGPKARRPAQND